MKLKTRLIIAFFVILFVPFLMFGIAFFGFSKYQMQAIEQSYGVPMSWDTLSDTMQVIGKSTEKVFKELKSQAEKDPDRFLDEAYLEKMNLELGSFRRICLCAKIMSFIIMGQEKMSQSCSRSFRHFGNSAVLQTEGLISARMLRRL